MRSSYVTAVVLAALCIVPAAASAQSSRRTITLDDLAQLKEVRDPQLSPDGKWVAYTVGTDRRRKGQARHATSGW